jgi:hypothetical protein
MGDSLVNSPLFIKLREYSIGAYGRATMHTNGFSAELKGKDDGSRNGPPPFISMVIERLVLASCWMTNRTSINILSTIHQMEPEFNRQS